MLQRTDLLPDCNGVADSCTAATPGLGFGFDLDLDLEDQLAERERL